MTGYSKWAAAALLAQCGDLRAMFKRALSSDGTMSPEAASCVVDGLDDATFDRLHVLSVSGGEAALDADPDLTGAMQDAVLTCMAAGVGGWQEPRRGALR